MHEKNLKTLLGAMRTESDINALESIIKKFEPLVKKYAKQLNYDVAESDIKIFLIELVYRLKPQTIQSYSDGELVNYIKKSIKNKTIDLWRKSSSDIEEISIDETTTQIACDYSFESTSFVQESLTVLSEKQRIVVIAKFIFGYSDVEIAKVLNISRQAVNKLQLYSLESQNIRNYSDGELVNFIKKSVKNETIDLLRKSSSGIKEISM
jgi:RNA polymerase sigma factor (sigma-70 family)